MEQEDKKRVVPSKRAASQEQKRKRPKRDPFVRAANEDDDGYDPYSDRPADDPFYEADPWR